MEHWRIISLVLAISMAILNTSQAQNEPDDFLDAHGCIRRLLDIPALKWDPALASTAQAYADKRKDCATTPSGKAGENISSGPNLNASYCIQSWVEERPNFDGEKCVPGKECLHYTQVIWKKTERVGCGRAKCDGGDNYVIVCNYDPPGNVAGEKP